MFKKKRMISHGHTDRAFPLFFDLPAMLLASGLARRNSFLISFTSVFFLVVVAAAVVVAVVAVAACSFNSVCACRRDNGLDVKERRSNEGCKPLTLVRKSNWGCFLHKGVNLTLEATHLNMVKE